MLTPPENVQVKISQPYLVTSGQNPCCHAKDSSFPQQGVNLIGYRVTPKINI